MSIEIMQQTLGHSTKEIRLSWSNIKTSERKIKNMAELNLLLYGIYDHQSEMAYTR